MFFPLLTFRESDLVTERNSQWKEHRSLYFVFVTCILTAVGLITAASGPFMTEEEIISALTKQLENKAPKPEVKLAL